MRWLTLLILLASPVSYGTEMNASAAIQQSIVDPNTFSFFYIGHAYGAHNGGDGKNRLAYPHPEIIRSIEQLKEFNFGAFGGDIVEFCNPQTIEAFERFVVRPLKLPLINSMGNHDHCLANVYEFPALQSFSKGGNTFLIISSSEKSLDKQQIDWLADEIRQFKQQSAAQNLFIFTHRPAFMLLDPSLQKASRLANYPVDPDDYFSSTITDAFMSLEARKNVYWFAGDVGVRLSLVYKALKENIHLYASGVYERDSDHYLGITIDQGRVDVKAINFLTGAAEHIAQYGESDSMDHGLLPGAPLEEGWAESMVASLYQSIGLDNGTSLEPVRAEGDTALLFDAAFNTETNSLILSNSNCADSLEYIFYVQFHPVHPEDRKNGSFVWNGYHFYASRIGTGAECVGIIPLPDYPLKHVLTGQLSGDRKQLWQIELHPPTHRQP